MLTVLLRPIPHLISMHWPIVNNRQQNIAPGFQILLLIAAAMVARSAANAQTPEGNADVERFFADKIEPLLRAHCLECHSHAAEQMGGGLTLDSRNGWEEGGGRGPAIVPGNPDESLLIKAVRHEDADLKMPPDEKLTAADIMTKTPKTINRDEFAVLALQIMQQNNITQLVVKDGDKVAGFVHLHDLLKEGIV